MHISKFRISHYKSFHESEALNFNPGINIIVGQNNSGKTALLEALSLNFSDEPHRSKITLPTLNSSIKTQSKVEVSLSFDKNEIREALAQIEYPLWLPEPDESLRLDDLLLQTNNDYLIFLFTNWLNNDKETAFLKLTINPEKQILYFKDSLENDIGNLIFNLYKPKQDKDRGANYAAIIIKNNPDDSWGYYGTSNYKSTKDTLGVQLFYLFSQRIYRFYAERLNVGKCLFGNSQELKPDASNLPEVLNKLQGNPEKFNRFNKYVSIICPQIKRISVSPLPGQLEIRVWTIDTKEEREDLTFPLSACGTGIGQVLSILYIVLHSEEPRIIIIDEPQSFLHPGAAKNLVEILKEFPQHQYFISTHSPIIISTSNPSTIIQTRYNSEKSETETSLIDWGKKDIPPLFRELGINLSDTFGADNILWVEGPTEETCFPLILERQNLPNLLGLEILAVKNTGDLDGKHAKLIFEIYERLSGGNTLFPPAIGFILDREGRTDKDIEDLRKRSPKENPNFINLLSRRMYENYLLCPEAIALCINNQDTGKAENMTSEKVSNLLEEKKKDKKYFFKNSSDENLSNQQWLEQNINGAKVLEDLFSDLSEARLEYRKTVHSVELTKWLLENQPDALSEIVELLQSIIK